MEEGGVLLSVALVLLATRAQRLPTQHPHTTSLYANANSNANTHSTTRTRGRVAATTRKSRRRRVPAPVPKVAARHATVAATFCTTTATTPPAYETQILAHSLAEPLGCKRSRFFLLRGREGELKRNVCVLRRRRRTSKTRDQRSTFVFVPDNDLAQHRAADRFLHPSRVSVSPHS